MKSYLSELGNELLKITQDPKIAKRGIRQAINTASECLEDERNRQLWTEADTYYCIIGETAKAMNLENSLKDLQPFSQCFNEILTEYYKRLSPNLLDNASRIISGVLGAFEIKKHNL